MKVLSHRRSKLVCRLVLALLFASGWNQFVFAGPSADLDHCRNGAADSPHNCVDDGGLGWVNGNIGSSGAHYLESWSIPYRVVMTELPLNTEIKLTIGYDIKHSGTHALDFLTHYNRLEPHGQFFGPDHPNVAETIDPVSGVAGVSGLTTTFPIPAPSATSPCVSPVGSQPVTRFTSLPVAEREMTLFGGTISNIQYVSQGCLTASQAETTIEVTFTVNSSTAVLAFGGHIAAGADWNNNSAGTISGSPYHMRLKTWRIGGIENSLGNQDRSLSASAVLDPCAGISCSEDTCETRACINGLCVQTSVSPDNTLCRASAGLCDAADYCDGENGFCPDTKQSSGTVCRPASDVCDVPEMCDGTSNACPADGFASNTTECRPSSGICDLAEMCTGKSAACPADSFRPVTFQCRQSAGVCDAAEYCNGSSVDCPSDEFIPANTKTICRPSAGVCDLAEICDGSSAACPNDLKSTAMCRGANGNVCDVPEYCNGQDNACPIDAYATAGTACGSQSNNACDAPDRCNATGQCIDHVKGAGTECRPIAGHCDVAETCNGTSKTCPTDGFLPATTVCRAVNGVCDIEEKCTGYSATCPADGFVPASADQPCREGDGVCNPDEFCSGTSRLCPNDVVFDPGLSEACQALQVAVCRTPGFWGTHGGTDKKSPKVKNITLAVIDASNGSIGDGGRLNICGEYITNTTVNDAASALEAICVPVRGDQRLQLARQLTAAALNCVVSGGGDDCGWAAAHHDPPVTGVAYDYYQPLFNNCNVACANPDDPNNVAMYGACIFQLDCLNNGGDLLEINGKLFCQTGTCSDATNQPCNGGNLSQCADPTTATCQRLMGTCHDQQLCLHGFDGLCFDETGPAGSAAACNDANNNNCTVIGVGEYSCKPDSCAYIDLNGNCVKH